MEWYHVCWPRLTAKRVEPVVSISWASCKILKSDTPLPSVNRTSEIEHHWVMGGKKKYIEMFGSFTGRHCCGRSSDNAVMCCVAVLVLMPRSDWRSGRRLLEECFRHSAYSVLGRQVCSDTVRCRHYVRRSGEHGIVDNMTVFCALYRDVHLSVKRRPVSPVLCQNGLSNIFCLCTFHG